MGTIKKAIQVVLFTFEKIANSPMDAALIKETNPKKPEKRNVIPVKIIRIKILIFL